MTVSRRTLPIAVAAVLAFGLAYAVTQSVAARPRSSTTKQSDYLPSARTWVPFKATIRVTHLGHDGGKARGNRHYQNSAGSTRFESDSPDGKTAVTIHNYERAMSYAQSPYGDWSALPMKATAARAPRKLRLDTVGLSQVPEKPVLGYTVYSYTSQGQTSFLAPDLNLYPLLTVTAKGLREEVISIVRGEPSQDLFVPPPNAEIRLAADMKDLLRVRRPGQ